MPAPSSETYTTWFVPHAVNSDGIGVPIDAPLADQSAAEAVAEGYGLQEQTRTWVGTLTEGRKGEFLEGGEVVFEFVPEEVEA